MKKIIISALVAAATAPAMIAQSSIDALQLTQPSFRGTARYMSMGGAFTALGGDLSAVIQNPAGIGVYRRSEIGATVDLNMASSKANYGDGNKTNFSCNNFGYIGTVNLSGAMETFSFGASYNRLGQFNRRTKAYSGSTSTSLTNYIASFMSGVSESELGFGTNYNPYEGSVDWLGALAYNSYLINPVSGYTDQYDGLFGNKTNADALIDVYETGYVDEYNLTFGGNFSNTVYWGIGVGIEDIEYKRYVDYSESMENADAYNAYRGGIITNSDAGYYLSNDKRITGTGWKLDFGLIVKPVNEFRIGAAIHTPTYYDLKTEYQGAVDYSFYDPTADKVTDMNPTQGNEYTDYALFDWRLKSPWRFNIGVAGVIGSQAIISLDYERLAYNDMKIQNAIYDSWGGSTRYEDNDPMNEDIRNYTRGGNIVRLGLEYRVTPQFSVRAGYNVQASNIKSEAADSEIEVVTSGTDPSYSFDKTVQNVSAGLGYRFSNGWYIDGAYVYNNRKSTLHPYTSFNGGTAPSFAVTDNNHSVVVSLGYRF
jgi:hypothetical protein